MDVEQLKNRDIGKVVAAIALPMLAVMVVNIGFNYLDVWYVSKLGVEVLHAIDILYPYLNLFSAIVYAGLGTGCAFCKLGLEIGFVQQHSISNYIDDRIGIIVQRGTLISIFVLVLAGH